MNKTYTLLSVLALLGLSGCYVAPAAPPQAYVAPAPVPYYSSYPAPAYYYPAPAYVGVSVGGAYWHRH